MRITYIMTTYTLYCRQMRFFMRCTYARNIMFKILFIWNSPLTLVSVILRIASITTTYILYTLLTNYRLLFYAVYVKQELFRNTKVISITETIIKEPYLFHKQKMFVHSTLVFFFKNFVFSYFLLHISVSKIR